METNSGKESKKSYLSYTGRNGDIPVAMKEYV
jgi:hypothetical protein